MYTPSPNEMFDYDQYIQYLKNILIKMEKDIDKDKKIVEDHLDNYRKNVGIASVSNDGIHYFTKIVSRDTEEFILSVGLAYTIYLREKEYTKLMDELAYLQTDQGKKEYENKTGKYSNTILL